jgi:hypothetical protein
MGFQEHLPENVRLEEMTDWLIVPSAVKQQFRAIAIIESKAGDMVLQGDICHRVAKNLPKYASAEALSFEGLQALSRPGYKVMFCARALTVHFPLTAPGTPDRRRWRRR